LPAGAPAKTGNSKTGSALVIQYMGISMPAYRGGQRGQKQMKTTGYQYDFK
jgi:hypothetical protein